MFKSARIKLTTWYLLIIMVISIAFSMVIYKMLTLELDRVERAQQLRIERGLPGNLRIIVPPGSDTITGSDDLRRSLYLDPNLISETKDHLKVILILIDLTILGTSAVAGYFLAGRTLEPISQMLEEQNRFVTDASHELRTPLTALKSEIEVNLRDKSLTILSAKKLLESNLEEVNNLEILSNNLIKLAAFKKGQNDLDVTNTPLHLATQKAISKVTSFAKSRDITILNEIGNQSIKADEISVVELFIIFLDNAIKYSQKGTTVTLTSKDQDGQVIVSIADQGVGISSKDIPHLFDRFYRSDKSRTKTDVQGFGLGLSIAKQIVDRYSGSIKVESELHKGSTFILTFPRLNSLGES